MGYQLKRKCDCGGKLKVMKINIVGLKIYVSAQCAECAKKHNFHGQVQKVG